MSRPAIDIDHLNAEQKLELIEVLWESLVADPSSIPITDAQKEMLDRRIAELESDLKTVDDKIAMYEEKSRAHERTSNEHAPDRPRRA